MICNFHVFLLTTGEATIEQETDGKRINVAVYLGSEYSLTRFMMTGNCNENGISMSEPLQPHCVIASVCISNKTTWDALDATVRRCFKEYVSRVDPVSNLGLGVECIAAYYLGEASRYECQVYTINRARRKEKEKLYAIHVTSQIARARCLFATREV